MNDLISRQAAIETVRKAKDKSEAHRMLIQLPSAQPGWISCKTKLPEKDGSYLVTAYNGQIAVYLFVKGMSENYWTKWAAAWMPLPEPWKEVQDE